MRKHKKQIVKKTLAKFQICMTDYRFSRYCNISQTQEITLSDDLMVSKHLNIPVKEYRKFLIENFNAKLATLDDVNDQGKVIKNPVIFFTSYQDAKTAKDWVNSTTELINKLAN